MEQGVNKRTLQPLLRSVADARAYRISVVVNAYNQAHFLGEALDSVLAQKHKADEIIVIDDGSNDTPQVIANRYADVRFVGQSNQGLAAARNAGLNAATSELIVFLDADDRLLPNALESGIAALANKPECAFAFGGHRRIDIYGSPIGNDIQPPAATGYYELLYGNQIGMHATVVYFRRPLLEAGGFDVNLACGEDYDVYLRLAQRYPIAVHRDVVAEYRRHGENMSNNAHRMLFWVLKIHDRQWPQASKDPRLAEAWRQGQMIWRSYYRREIRAGCSTASEVPTPPVGSANIADLARTRPISDEFGYDRGTPIDRVYIEDFLQRNSSSIRGRVLEVGDDTYSRRFGADRITKQDVLHVTTGNPAATIVGDLSTKGLLTKGAFDCLVLTQTLHLIYDMHAAVQEMHRALRPGGVVLVSVPGITRVDRGPWGKDWFWSFTEASARRLFAEVFGAENVTVETDGNVYAATLFLQGLAAEEADKAMLAAYDPCFPVLISVRAQKSLGWREALRRVWKRLRPHD
jgi:glycosyltransferase involved in cell wall biosynthesis